MVARPRTKRGLGPKISDRPQRSVYAAAQRGPTISSAPPAVRSRLLVVLRQRQWLAKTNHREHDGPADQGPFDPARDRAVDQKENGEKGSILVHLRQISSEAE